MNSPVVYITVSGMLFSIVLIFFDKGYKKANAYLAGFLFLSSLFYLIQYVFIFSHSLKAIIWFAAGLPATVYLIGPFAYLYIRSILRDNTRLSKKDYLHFIIFIVVFAGTIPYIFSNLDHKMNIARCIESNNWGNLKYRPNAIVPPIINRFLRPLHPLVYAIATWCLIFNYKNKIFNNKNHSYDFTVIKKWILIFSGFFFMAALLHQIIFIDSLFVDYKSVFISRSYPLMIVFSVLYVLMIIALLFFPHILYGMPVRSQPIPSSQIISLSLEDNLAIDLKQEVSKVEDLLQEKEKYLQLFSEEYVKELSQKISDWVKQEYYLKEDCSLSSLALQMQLPQHHLSYFFNTILDTKFTDWRNNLRVDFSKRLLDNDITKSITMEALALKSGFASQTTFNRAFKNSLGLTPSQYLKLRG